MNTTFDQNEYSTLNPEKRGMNKKAVVMTVVIFLLIITGMFGFAYLKSKENQQIAPVPTDEEVKEVDRYADITRVDGKHFYIDGVHTIVGEILMPTPCDLLSSEATVAESYPEQITLDFSVLNNAEFCAEVITPARFKVSATASEEATFSARFNGRLVELNLTPAADGETPEDFELFIKG